MSLKQNMKNLNVFKFGYMPLCLFIFLCFLLNNEVAGQSSNSGTIILYNEGELVLDVYDKDDNLIKTSVRQKERVRLEGMKRGAYLHFKNDDSDVRSRPIYLWNVDNLHTYHIKGQKSTDPREKAVAMSTNLKGIDLSTVNPRSINSTLTNQIFEAMESTSTDYHTAEGAPGLYIKDGFEYSPLELGMGESSSKMRYSSESIKKSWSINVDLEASVPVKGAKIDADVGVGYSEFNDSYKEQKEIYLEKSLWVGKHSIKCDPSRAELTERFKLAVKNLPMDYNSSTKEKYEKFVKLYGTHFLSEVTYGGFYNSFVNMSENTFSSLQGSELDVKTGVGISAPDDKASGNLKVEYNRAISEELKQMESNMKTVYEYAGGSGGFDNWKVDEDVAPVIIKPQLISELIKPEVFRDNVLPEKLAKIKTNLEEYLAYYFSTMPKQQSLQAPPVIYTLEIISATISAYRDAGDALQEADIELTVYAGDSDALRGNTPKIDMTQGDSKTLVYKELKFNPNRKLNKDLLGTSFKRMDLVVMHGNPDKRLFKIVGNFREGDTNFGGRDERWVLSRYITPVSVTNIKEKERTGTIVLGYEKKRWGYKQQLDLTIKYKLTRKDKVFDTPKDVTVNSPKITFANNGTYIARYKITYNYKGHTKIIKTDNVAQGGKREYELPHGATNIRVKGDGVSSRFIWGTYIWTNHFDKTYKEPVSKKFTSLGTSSNQSYRE